MPDAEDPTPDARRLTPDAFCATPDAFCATPDALGAPPDWLAEQARQRPGAAAVIAAGETLTYAELDARVTALAGELVARGVASGEPVGAWLPLTPDSVVCIHAAARAGAVLVPLNTRLTTEELAWQIAHVGARFVLVAGDDAPVLPMDVAAVNGGGSSDVGLPPSSLFPPPSSPLLPPSNPSSSPQAPQADRRARC